MKRLKLTAGVFSLIGACLASSAVAQDPTNEASRNEKPNVILIYADDLGAGLLGFNGQKIIKTPNIDRLAEEGMRFSNAYGAAYCAPARGRLMTGLHCATKGAFRISQPGLIVQLDEGKITQEQFDQKIKKSCQPAQEGEIFLAQIAQKAGYKTAQFGKMEFGFTTTHERLKRHGWDHYFGYMDHVRCHGFYPPYLWLNGEKYSLDGNLNPDAKKKKDDPEGTYSQLVFIEHILKYLDEHKDERFFLYHPTQLPHGPVAIPEIHSDFENDERLDETEKKYASMVKMLDDHVGLIMDRLKQNKMDQNTVVIFTSDNGHEMYYANRVKGKAGRAGRSWHGEGDVFNGNMGRASKKWYTYEGGINVPLIVRWPGKIAPGTVSDLQVAEHDIMPTLAELVGTAMPAGKSGLSYLPTLLGQREKQKRHECLLFGSKGPTIIAGDYKLVHVGAVARKKKGNRMSPGQELFNLKKDPGERVDLSLSMPEKVEQLETLFRKHGKQPRRDIPSVSK
ncbi:hypothetical protein BVY04_03370 [bacterium M21]|nr:hypothetical protein BVY04_03370 [bacterium M21]